MPAPAAMPPPARMPPAAKTPGGAPAAQRRDPSANVSPNCRVRPGQVLAVENVTQQCSGTIPDGGFVGPGIHVTLAPAQATVRSGQGTTITARFSNTSPQPSLLQLPVRVPPGQRAPALLADTTTLDAQGFSADTPLPGSPMATLWGADEGGVRVVLEPGSSAAATFPWGATGYISSSRQKRPPPMVPRPKGNLLPGVYTVELTIRTVGNDIWAHTSIRVVP